jgi:hypothetical protein
MSVQVCDFNHQALKQQGPIYLQSRANTYTRPGAGRGRGGFADHGTRRGGAAMGRGVGTHAAMAQQAADNQSGEWTEVTRTSLFHHTHSILKLFLYAQSVISNKFSRHNENSEHFPIFA